MYRFTTAQTLANNAARIESFMYIAETGHVEVVYSVGEESVNGTFTALERKTITFEKTLHASSFKEMTEALLRELFTLLNSVGKLPAGAVGAARGSGNGPPR